MSIEGDLKANLVGITIEYNFYLCVCINKYKRYICGVCFFVVQVALLSRCRRREKADVTGKIGGLSALTGGSLRIMEQTHGACKSSKFASDDVISNMPDDVLTNILNRLPLQDAVRTGTLSRSWRYKWTMISQIMFDEDFYEYLQEIEREKHYGRIIDMFLRHHKGAVTKFHLYIEKGCNSILDVDDISNWILVLYQKGILDFTLLNMEATPLKLPTHLFSCLKLKHLKLFKCHFCPVYIFGGFPNLLSLDLSEVVFGSYRCGEFVSRSPSLEILKLRDNTPSKIKRAEIAELKNLKVLYLPLCELDNMTMITSSSIFQLMGCFPKLQKLNLDFWDCKVSADAEISVRTTLPCLKTLRLYEVDFSNGNMVSCAIDLICGFPNLETLLIKSAYEDDDPLPAVPSSEVDFSRLGQLQLRKVEFVSFGGLENEECMRTSLLNCSPFLKEMDISALEVLPVDDRESISSNSLITS